MANWKCKLCGGDIEAAEGTAVAQCPGCGGRQTLPTVEHQKAQLQFNRANRLRMVGEFDKAGKVYAALAAEYPGEPEALWGLILCRYGVDYEDGKPVCRWGSLDNVMESPELELVMENADAAARRIYREEARQLEALRLEILAEAEKEGPCQVYLCRKETAEDGGWTQDSVLALEVFDLLTAQGRQVFLPREDASEAQIFAGLSSAKVMLVFGTDYEYFNDVWVKDQWSRYLALGKPVIPCYLGIDQYDIPKEFAQFPSLDLAEGTDKLLKLVNSRLPAGEIPGPEPKEVPTAPQPEPPVPEPREPEAEQTPPAVEEESEPEGQMPPLEIPKEKQAAQLAAQGHAALKNREWARAKDFYDQAADKDSQCAAAYLGRALAAFQVGSLRELWESLELREPVEAENLRVMEPDAQAETELLEGAKGKGFPEADVLRAARSFRFTIKSRTRPTQEAGRQAWKQLAENQDLILAEQYGSEKIQDQLTMCRNKVRASYDTAVQQSKAEDEKKTAALHKKYETHMNQQRMVFGLPPAPKKPEAQEGSQATEKSGQAPASGEQKQTGETPKKPKEPQKPEKAREPKKPKPPKEPKPPRTPKAPKVKTPNSPREGKPGSRKKLGIALAAAAVVLVLAVTLAALPTVRYSRAESLAAKGEYARALERFTALGDYRDSAVLAESLGRDYGLYQQACTLREEGSFWLAKKTFEKLEAEGTWEELVNQARSELAAMASDSDMSAYIAAEEQAYFSHIVEAALGFGKLGDYQDARQRSYGLWNQLLGRSGQIAAGLGHTVGLRSDGTVVAVGSNGSDWCHVGGWTDIAAVAAGDQHTVGLRIDGTVVAAGNQEDGRCDVSSWTDIIEISAGAAHTVGLRQDGTVAATGGNDDGQCEVSSWAAMIAVSAGGRHTVGLRSDGTVVAAGSNTYGQCEVSDWTDIVAVAAGSHHTIGLRSDGTVVAVGSDNMGQCKVSSWTDIAAVSAGWAHTVGLKLDGTMEAVGSNHIRQCGVFSWENILSVAAGDSHTLGLRANGTVVATGNKADDRCNVFGWTDIGRPAGILVEPPLEEPDAGMAESSDGDAAPVETEDPVTAQYHQAEALEAQGRLGEAAIAFGRLGDYQDARQRSRELWSNLLSQSGSISADSDHSAGLRSDGTVVAAGYDAWGQCDVSDWRDMVMVSVGSSHTLGLRSDGTVAAVGDQENGQCEVSGWRDIVSVSAAGIYSVGVRSDGTVVMTGNSGGYPQLDMSGWTDIVYVSAEDDYAVGLRSDGTLVAAADNPDSQIDVSGWTDIVFVSAGSDHTVGVRSDGTAVAAGRNNRGQCDVSDWSELVMVSAALSHTVGLRSDGTVIATGDNEHGQCNVSDWTEIVAIVTAQQHTLGLRADGTVVATGYNVRGKCNVSAWRDIRRPTK